MTTIFVSYGPNCEDVPLWRALSDIANGAYIDVGPEPADGASVTRAFYDRGWHGFAVRSSAEASAAYSAARPRDTVMTNVPLSGIATSDVHFVRIKDRTSQSSILRALTLPALKPWIVVVEAGCAESDGLLKSANYQPVLFDGISDFYVSPAHAARAARLAAPANANDGFIRWDAPLRDRVTALGAALAAAQASIEGRSQRLLDSARMLGHARRDIELLAKEADWLRSHLAETRAAEAKLRAEIVWLQGQLSAHREEQLEQLVARTDEVVWLRTCLSQSEAKVLSLQNAGLAQSSKMSRRLPRWLARRFGALLPRRNQRTAPAIPPGLASDSPPLIERTQSAAAPVWLPDPLPCDGAQPPSAPAIPPRSISAVHQFHPGSSQGDAITNAMLLIQSQLRSHGFQSEIFVETRGHGLETQIHLIESFPMDDPAFLLVHHSMGFDTFDHIVTLPVQKGLIYHNITPPELFAHLPHMVQRARLGHEQLARWRQHVVFALSVSDFNAADLHRLGYPNVRTCPLLCDTSALLHRAAGPRPERRIFTVLFVGRVTPSKGQLDLVAAFAAFHARFGRPCRLILIGAFNPDEFVYLEAIESLVASKNLQGAVQLTDLISDAELHAWYRQADLYVSLSLHEGFGVPLLEAMAYGIPLLAWPAGAVPQTLGDAGTLLTSREPDAVAEAMLAITQRSAGAAQAAHIRGMVSLQRFAPDLAFTTLLDALAQAGVSQAHRTAGEGQARSAHDLLA